MRIRVQFVVAVLVLALAGAPAATQSTSELLEKGIYTEETVGDVDQAIEIYRAIADESEATRPLVAEALLRLGLCQIKNGDEAAATAAFERLIADFPDQKRFVAEAHDNMPDDPQAFELLPAPWTDGEVQQYTLKLASGVTIGTIFISADLVDVEGEPLWRLRVRRWIVTDRNNQAISQTLARRDTLVPVRSMIRHTLIGHFEALYGEGSVKITTVGPATEREQEISGRFFDNEEGFQLVRRMPLEVGYKAAARFFTPVDGSVTPVEVEVTEKAMLQVPAGDFEAYRVEFSVGQTFWYSTDPSRYLVKFEGSGITGELDRVFHQYPGEPHSYKDDVIDFSISAPPDWLSYELEQNGEEALVLLDPNAAVRGSLQVHYEPNDGNCTRETAAKRALDTFRVRYPDHALREEEWVERTIAGRPSGGFVADYEDEDREMVLYWTYIRSGYLCVEFSFRVERDRFEGLREDLDAIIESYDGPRAQVIDQPDSESSKLVKTVIDDFHLAAAEADTSRFFSHLAPDLVYLATDPTERFDLKQLRALVEPHFSQGNGWVAEPIEQHLFLSDDETLAWFDERLESRKFGEMRASGVLRKDAGRWRIVQYSLGFPIPNELVAELNDEIRAHDEATGRPPVTTPVGSTGAADGAAGAVESMLNDFHLAASEADGERYFGYLASDGIFLGTDRTERFTLAKFKAFAGPYLSRGVGWTSTPVEQNVFVAPDGKYAWFEERLQRERVGEMRGTGVARKRDGRWTIVHYNAVIPVPNELTADLLQRTRTIYETTQP